MVSNTQGKQGTSSNPSTTSNPGGKQQQQQQEGGSANRGSAAMDPDRQRDIASQGGTAGAGQKTPGSHMGQDSSHKPGSPRGGTSEQHAAAGRQGHKNT